jgi:hypothetical protein
MPKPKKTKADRMVKLLRECRDYLLGCETLGADHEFATALIADINATIGEQTDGK